MPVLRPGTGPQIGGAATVLRTSAPLSRAALTTTRAYDWVQGSVTYTAPAATGGFQPGGAATADKIKAPQISGGLHTGGAATVSKTKAVSGAGGFQSGGAATVAKTKAVQASGGFQAAGDAAVAKTKASSSTGGLQAAGSAVTLFTAGDGGGDTDPPSTTYSYTGSGGLVVAGSAVCGYAQPEAANPPAAIPPGSRPAHLIHLPVKPAPPTPPALHAYVGTGGLHLRGAGVTGFSAATSRGVTKAQAVARAPAVAEPVPQQLLQVAPAVRKPSAQPPREISRAAAVVAPAPPPPSIRSIEGVGGLKVGGAAVCENHLSLLGLDEDEIMVLLEALTA